ncbi:hypothetical protein NBRC116590_02630 [Pelagimonas sp. KU-00592-HH]|uniref:hypothetical protein n=1 Tax=Pelagimonas sp. KU-00592-HH TaxID=3127651 RepID=UPI00310B62C0
MTQKWLSDDTFIDDEGLLRGLNGGVFEGDLEVTGGLQVAGDVEAQSDLLIGLATGGGALAKLGQGQGGGDIFSIRPTDISGAYQNDREFMLDPENANVWKIEGGVRVSGALDVPTGGAELHGGVKVQDLLKLNPTTAPASPERGDVYFDDATDKLRCHDGTTWHDLF